MSQKKKEPSPIDPSTLPEPGITTFATDREQMTMSTHHIARILGGKRPQEKLSYLNALAAHLSEEFFRDSPYWHRFQEDVQLKKLKAQLDKENPKWQAWRHYGYRVDPRVLEGTRQAVGTLDDETYVNNGDLERHRKIWNGEEGQLEARFFDWRPVIRELEAAQQFRDDWLQSRMQGGGGKEKKGKFVEFGEWLKYSDPSIWDKVDFMKRYQEALSEGGDWKKLAKEVTQPRGNKAIQCQECPQRLRMLRALQKARKV